MELDYHRETGLPIYFRYVAGNIVDVSTLQTTVNELKAQGINLRHGILDAGYCSQKNIKILMKDNIPFLTRMQGKNWPRI
jgi:transposase